ncbi:MAG: hypothetical protein U9R79_11640 [Armatimonadota bacterium]|nr:hypothetical protein [Armatimonadota bacterium]
MRIPLIAASLLAASTALAQPRLLDRQPLLAESFEAETNGWRLVLNRGAQAEMALAQDAVLGSRCVRISPQRLRAADDRAFSTNIHLRYETLSLRADTPYVLSAWLRSSGRRLAAFRMRRNSVEEAVGGPAVEIGPGWRRHEMAFELSEDYPDAVPQILLAQALEPVWIDAVTIVEHRATELAPADYLQFSEKLRAPAAHVVRLATDFEDATHPWQLQLNRGARAEVALEEAAGGRCLRVTPAALCAPNDRDYPTNIHLKYQSVALRAEQEYVMSARLRSDGPRPAAFRVRAGDGSGAVGGPALEVTGQWQRFEWAFTPESDMPAAIAQILVGGDMRPLWVDDIVISEAGCGDELPEDCVARGNLWLRPQVLPVDVGKAAGPLSGLHDLGPRLPATFRLHLAADMFGAEALRVALVGEQGDPVSVTVGETLRVARGDEQVLEEGLDADSWAPGEAVTLTLERLGDGLGLRVGDTVELSLPEEGTSRVLIGAAEPGQAVRILAAEGYEMLSTERPDGSTEKEEYTDPVTGRRIVRLTHSPFNDKHAYYDISPWSPDGSLIAFSSALPGERQGTLYVMDADGTNIRKVAEGHGFNMHTGIFNCWAPDGEHIYFNTRWEDEGGEWIRGVALADVNTGEVERYEGLGMRQVSWANGRVLWMENGRGEDDPVRGLYSSAPEGSDVRLLCRTADIEALSPTQDIHGDCARLGLTNCKWSPDGTKVMVVLVGYDEQGSQLVKEIYIADADGGDLHFVMTFRHHHMWHPNSRQVIGNCEDGLYIVNADGSGRRKITDLAQGHPSFSPDGSMIVTDCYGGEYADMLVLIDPETGEIEPLCSVPTVHGRSHEVGTHPHPCWAPDGRSILYDSDQEGHCQLYQVFVDG